MRVYKVYKVIMIDITLFESKIGIIFKNKDLLLQALAHRSYLNENPDFKLGHNERLEFLGDAILEFSVTDYLYKNYPEHPEGELTNYRASIVNANVLGEIGSEIGLNDFLLLSRGEAKDVGKARIYILANAMESVIGAIYLDQGYAAVDEFIKKFILTKLPLIIEKRLYRDPKSIFQEEAQEKTGITPVYKVLKEWGPDHEKHFVVGVYLGDELVAEGEGSSKQTAQEEAAQVALHKKEWR